MQVFEDEHINFLRAPHSGSPHFARTSGFSDGEETFQCLKHYSFDDYYPVSSFKWIQKGVEFEVAAYEVLSYISSTSTIFTYRKI